MSEKKRGQTGSQEYFVSRLTPDSPPFKPGQTCQIQILDSSGRAACVGYVGETERDLSVEGHIVPSDVLDAARRQPEGKGDYVNEKGESIPPF